MAIKHKIRNFTGLRVNISKEGEPIETKIRRIEMNGEAIKDGAQLEYTEKADGVRPEYDIRTDRWEIAVEAGDTLTKARMAKAEGVMKVNDVEPIPAPIVDNNIN